MLMRNQELLDKIPANGRDSSNKTGNRLSRESQTNSVKKGREKGYKKSPKSAVSPILRQNEKIMGKDRKRYPLAGSMSIR
jgi:hypothetical protein